jgi:hypothetical protein
VHGLGFANKSGPRNEGQFDRQSVWFNRRLPCATPSSVQHSHLTLFPSQRGQIESDVRVGTLNGAKTIKTASFIEAFVARLGTFLEFLGVKVPW